MSRMRVVPPGRAGVKLSAACSLPFTASGAPGAVHKMLFLCTHNSARSILAEAILNGSGDPRLRAYSAGSAPSGRVNPYAIKALILLGYDVHGLRSKSWREFLEPGAPLLDRVVTVCDSAAAEVCPAWPGGPEVMHWGLADPSVAGATDAERLGAFLATAHEIEGRLNRMLPGLPRFETRQELSISEHPRTHAPDPPQTNSFRSTGEHHGKRTCRT